MTHPQVSTTSVRKEERRKRGGKIGQIAWQDGVKCLRNCLHVNHTDVTSSESKGRNKTELDHTQYADVVEANYRSIVCANYQI